ncbi:MAG: hypothetical protein CMJ31_02810 [Phycisphaerae bacterium]|nr:hypothetical protein [Phycisphaerae bacterium]
MTRSLPALTPLALLLAPVLGLLGGCANTDHVTMADPAAATAPAPTPPPRTMEWNTFERATRSDVWIGGQPSEQALDDFAAHHGATVINLRTDGEMEPLPGYADAVRARGMNYVHVPVSGATLDAERYQLVSDAIDSASGPVLLHCASGGRATYMWGMRLIDDGRSTPQTAIEWCHARRGSAWETGDKALMTFGQPETPDAADDGANNETDANEDS